MASELTAEAVWRGDWRFDATTGTGHEIIMDAAVADGGTEAGARPMELLLVGVAGCTAMDVVSILEKMRQEVQAYQVKISAQRAEDHPKVFTHIVIEHLVTGHVEEGKLAHAIQLSNDRYCSAQAMMRGQATIETKYTILEP